MQFEQFVERVVRYYNGKVSIVLFGSRARGDFWPSSDYDVLIVLDKVNDEIEEASKLYTMKRGFSADIIVVTPDKLELGDVKEMLKHKKVLYDGLGVFKTEEVNSREKGKNGL
ncbi:nucleotidyltransferase domain-containing protein [Stygiolobus sp. CP850M]|jgi:Nucleotidyltransferase domain.